jgi:hypothetical protein
LRSLWAAPVTSPTSNSIKRCAAKPIISRRKVASEPFSSICRRAILSSVFVVGPRSAVAGLDNPTLPKITAVAARGAPLRSAKGFAARPRLWTSNTTTRDTTVPVLNLEARSRFKAVANAFAF